MTHHTLANYNIHTTILRMAVARRLWRRLFAVARSWCFLAVPLVAMDGVCDAERHATRTAHGRARVTRGCAVRAMLRRTSRFLTAAWRAHFGRRRQTRLLSVGAHGTVSRRRHYAARRAAPFSIPVTFRRPQPHVGRWRRVDKRSAANASAGHGDMTQANLRAFAGGAV